MRGKGGKAHNTIGYSVCLLIWASFTLRDRGQGHRPLDEPSAKLAKGNLPDVAKDGMRSSVVRGILFPYLPAILYRPR